jgi:hypothetical protein
MEKLAKKLNLLLVRLFGFTNEYKECIVATGAQPTIDLDILKPLAKPLLILDLFIRKCNENAKQNLSVTPIWTTVANYG